MSMKKIPSTVKVGSRVYVRGRGFQSVFTVGYVERDGEYFRRDSPAGLYGDMIEADNIQELQVLSDPPEEGVLYAGEVVFAKYTYWGRFVIFDGKVRCLDTQDTRPKIIQGEYEWLDNVVIGDRARL